MEVKTSKPYQAVQNRFKQTIDKRNAKRGHISHAQVFVKETTPRKVRSLTVVALAALGLGVGLKSGFDAVTDSKKGYTLAIEAGGEVRNCAANGLGDCALNSSPETTVVVTTVTPEVSAPIMACADSVTVTYQGPSDMPDKKVAELNPELTPEELRDVLNGAFWDQNSLFDPNTLQGMYEAGQNPIFIAPKACAPYGG